MLQLLFGYLSEMSMRRVRELKLEQKKSVLHKFVFSMVTKLNVILDFCKIFSQTPYI